MIKDDNQCQLNIYFLDHESVHERWKGKTN